MRIAIAQMPMHWTPDENTRCVIDHLAQAKALAADLVVFPECSTTGYHRRVPEQISRRSIADAIERIQAQCAALRLPAIVGTPYYPSSDDAQVWNAAVAIDAGGQVQALCPKAGLTQSERRFFHPGTTRPSFTLGGVSCGVILCREVCDAELLRVQLAGAQLVFWPGVITWNDPEEVEPEDIITPETARACARVLGSYLIQCNWPNSLNRPELTGMGGSLVLSPTGELLYQCPIDEAGISLITVNVSGRAGGGDHPLVERAPNNGEG